MVAWPLPAAVLVVALALTRLVWLASLVERDASAIDVFRGFGFVLVAGRVDA
jgi:hypothetical protein